MVKAITARAAGQSQTKECYSEKFWFEFCPDFLIRRESVFPVNHVGQPPLWNKRARAGTQLDTKSAEMKCSFSSGESDIKENPDAFSNLYVLSPPIDVSTMDSRVWDPRHTRDATHPPEARKSLQIQIR